MFSCCNRIVCNSLPAIDAFPFSGYLRLSCEYRQAWGWNVFLFKQTRAAAVTISSSRFRAASRSQFTFPRSKMFKVSFLWGLSAFQCLLASPTETDGTIFSNVGKHACFKQVIVTSTVPFGLIQFMTILLISFANCAWLIYYSTVETVTLFLELFSF